MALDRLKSAVRLIEAAVAPRTDTVSVGGRRLRFVRSLWWHDASSKWFPIEIQPYFDVLAARGPYATIIDAGAAVGLFALAAAVHMPNAHIHAFEPSRRQRLLLARNARRNGFGRRITVWPVGLWNHETTLPFRTHGAVSALAPAASLFPAGAAFPERVRVVRLDDWAAPYKIDLIKMDIEGAELEALEGARGLLARDRPDVIVQAYHERDGSRTWERCAAMLSALDYECREPEAHAGLLLATPRGGRFAARL